MERRDVTHGAGERKLTCSTIRNSPPAPVAQFPSYPQLPICEPLPISLPSGFTIRMADTGAQKVQWQLRIFEISPTASEPSIESLFEASEGQLNTFTFLGSYRQSVDVERGLDASGVDAPIRCCRSLAAWRTRWAAATRCSSRTPRKLRNRSSKAQADQVRFVYCYSVYVRSAVPATIQTGCHGDGTKLL